MTAHYRVTVRGAFLLVLVVLGVALGVSCGTGPASDRESIRESFTKLGKRLEKRDVAGVCERMTDVAQKQVRVIGHADYPSCEQAVRELFKSIDGDPASRPVDPEIAWARIRGDQAKIAVEYDRSRMGAFAFSLDDGVWKMGSVFSVTATSPPYLGTPVPDLPSIGVPTARGQPSRMKPVSVRARGALCRRVKVGRVIMDVEGGCRVSLPGGLARLRLRSLFGDAPFATCELSFSMRVGAGGRIAIGDAVIQEGTRTSGPCSDIETCRVEIREEPDVGNLQLPWQGSLGQVGGSRLSAEIEFCFDSCAGRLQGLVRLRLDRDRGGWVLRASNSPVGRSGLSISGSWRSKPVPLVVR